MPGYNGYGAYGNNAYGVNNYNTNNYGANNNFGLTTDQIVQYFQQGKLVWSDYVHGKAGADTYQLPPGINMARLWDDESDRFYVKGYDNNGRPRVLDDNDFQTHVDPEPQNTYATKDDIKSMIAEAFAGIDIRPNMAGYVTTQQLDQALNGLSVGNGGRIVRSNE